MTSNEIRIYTEQEESKNIRFSLMKNSECDSFFTFVNRTPFVLFTGQTTCSVYTAESYNYNTDCRILGRVQ